MVDFGDIEAQQRALAEITAQALAASRAMLARVEAAETPEELTAAGLTLQRMHRSVRQSLALQAKLDGDRRRADREAQAEQAAFDEAKVERRREQVRHAVERLIWCEAEGAEAEVLELDLSDRLDEAELYDGFADRPLAAHIAGLCEELGLTPPSPLAGEGVGLGPDTGPTDEGSRGERRIASPNVLQTPARPLIRPAGAGSLLPQGEKDPGFDHSG